MTKAPSLSEQLDAHQRNREDFDLAREVDRESRAEIAALTAELDALKHDIERHIAIASEEATEAEALRARLAEAEAKVAVGVEALTQCAEWFRQYGVGHQRKRDADKAKRNFDRMQHALDALAEMQPPSATETREP